MRATPGVHVWMEACVVFMRECRRVSIGVLACEEGQWDQFGQGMTHMWRHGGWERGRGSCTAAQTYSRCPTQPFSPTLVETTGVPAASCATLPL